MTTVALIPSFEPDDRLLNLLAGLRARGIKRVVVDDGSGEQYRPLFRKATRDAVVLSYGHNQGKGHALKLGLRYIREHFPRDTVVVTVDADGQHTLEDTVRCADEAARNPRTMVLGSRTFDNDEVPLRSRFGNKVTCLAYRLTSGQFVRDTQTGLRAFSADLIGTFLEIAGERYEYEMNVLLACPEHHICIREVPIKTIYEDGNSSSHFRTVRDSARIYAGIFAFAGASFASFLVDYALFCLLLSLLAPVETLGVMAANVLARVGSAAFNYTLNRSYVFHSSESVAATAPRYAALAASLLAANTIMLGVLVGLLKAPALPAKLAVELTLFFVSWCVQNRFVFQRKQR